MTHYYQDSLITLYHGDCRDVLPDLPMVDAVITDPPFFMPAIHYSGRVRYQRSWGDTSILAAFWGVVLDAAMDRMLPTANLLAFCNGDSYPVFYPEAYRRFAALNCLVWDKGRIGLGRPWRHQHELIMAARWKDSYVGPEAGSSADVIKCAPVSPKDRVHPVDKPVGLLERIIVPCVPPGGTIIDPFAGGGSTLVAAQRTGRLAIGIETEEEYCEIIAKRLTADAVQSELALSDGVG